MSLLWHGLSINDWSIISTVDGLGLYGAVHLCYRSENSRLR